jgi:hypothetical protein
MQLPQIPEIFRVNVFNEQTWFKDRKKLQVQVNIHVKNEEELKLEVEI